MKYSKVIEQYDPTDNRSHGILKFFAEELEDNEKLQFIEEIFEYNSWILPTEISKQSNSNPIIDQTKGRFQLIFEDWVKKRIEHFNALDYSVKNPYLPLEYKNGFTEGLFSIRNLNFPDSLMESLSKFVFECKPNLLKRYLDHSIWQVVEEFEDLELEQLIFFFLKIDGLLDSRNFNELIHKLLSYLAYSHKVFNLSDTFLTELENYSSALIENKSYFNDTRLTSVLLVELITNKKLDLNVSQHYDLIKSRVDKVEADPFKKFNFFKFLKRFNYDFTEHDFNESLNSLFEGMALNIERLSECEDSKRTAILRHFTTSANNYVEVVLFYLENLDTESIFIQLKRLIELIDKFRLSFNKLIWFKEYLNFEEIPGEIHSVVDNGLSIQINANLVKKKLSSKDYDKPESINADYGYGFLNERNFKHLRDLNEFYDKHKSGNIKLNDSESIGVIANYRSYTIIDVNYSVSNKGSVLTLIPADISVLGYTKGYQLKSLFSSLELFLIEKAHSILGIKSPFINRKGAINSLLPNKFLSDYFINISVELFWELLSETRPILYDQIYLKSLNNNKTFENLKQAFKDDTIVKGVVKSRTNGGLIVVIDDFEVFLPGSHIDRSMITDFEQFIGEQVQAKVVRITEDQRNVVISRRVIKEEEYENSLDDLLKKLEIGDLVIGKVKNLTSYGAFIDIGGIDGLAHITDLSWDMVNHPNEILKLDQEVKVVVLEVDIENSRVYLGVKQLMPSPWETMATELKKGDLIEGTISNVVEFGVFIEVRRGIVGLAHRSESRKRVFKNLTVGKKINCQIISVNPKEKKLSLKIVEKSIVNWENLEKEIKLSSIYEGTIDGIQSFGLFVELPNGLTGLVHRDNISWPPLKANLNKKFNVGDKIEVKVLSINKGKRKIDLGIKQLASNPFDPINGIYSFGSTHEGVIESIENGTGFVKIDTALMATCPSRHMKKIDGSSAKLGETLWFDIIDVNEKTGKVFVSHTCTHSDIDIRKPRPSKKNRYQRNRPRK